MKVLIACEESATVREAFKRRGHAAWSCDILPSRIPGNHFQCDVFEVIGLGWDMMIAFPPCTDLCVSGARWFKSKIASGQQQKSVEFFKRIATADIPRVAVENPVGIMSRLFRKPDQIIQPWQFGHGETKATCLWLKNLPLLAPTEIVPGREQRIWRLPPSDDRARERSKTFQGIADAMSDQWS